jgi:protein-tyrosine phosphatase
VGLAGWLHGLVTQVRQLLVPAVGFRRGGLARVERLVFVCHANLYRSAFAQALCEQAGLRATSLGLHTLTGGRSPAAAVRAAAALGVRLEGHRATHRRDFKPADGDLYLVMSPRQARSLVQRGFPAERIALLGLWCRWRRLHIEDAHGEGEEALRRCFARVHEATLALGQEWHRARAEAAATPGCDAVDGLDAAARV